MTGKYQICTRCIMDTSDPEIKFDKDGTCNHCQKYDEVVDKRFLSPDECKKEIRKIIKRIKEKNRTKRYDCIIGVSGGVDSTYVAYLVKELGLRPLAVHLDNGWDSELAVNNIVTALKKLDIDLYTYVIDWEEFKDLQLAFLKASTPDSETPTDHAIIAILFQLASKYNIRYIILGENLATEAILPRHWSYEHGDWKYIRSIHKRFGKVKLKSFPHFNFAEKLFNLHLRHAIINILDYIDYNKSEAIKILEQKLGWRNYGGKHCESIYTRFFQGYILPKKFGYDKRRAHLSTLICSGQITRDEAFEEVKKAPYRSEELEKKDKEYVIKKLGLTKNQFENIMTLPTKSFKDYPTYANSLFYRILNTNSPFYKILKFLKRYKI